MNFQILDYHGTATEDQEIASLLTRVFVDGGYTDKSVAEKMFVPAELQKRGEIILARSLSQAMNLLGMAIFVRPTSPARQAAEEEADGAEIHLLAVHPEARGQGVASRLVMACEQRAASFGFSKMVLSTQQSMSEAHRLYERLGYQHKPARNWSKGKDRLYLVYEKNLSRLERDHHQ